MPPIQNITEHPAFSGLKIIDVDTHWSEPVDLWTSRAPAAMKSRVPRIERQGEKLNWVLGEDRTVIMPGSPISVIGTDGTKRRSGDFMASRHGEVHESSTNLKARLEVMDKLGIHAQILYPNVGGSMSTYFKTSDDELRGLMVRIYNDAAAEAQADTGNRILPMAVVPFWNIDEAVSEVVRAHELGMRGVVMGGDPHTANLPDLGTRHWDPLWEVCTDLGMPVNFHIGGSTVAEQTLFSASWPSQGPERWLALGSAIMYIDNARVIGNLILAGVPERFPRIQFVSVESGVGWIPFYLEALDYQAVESARTETAHLSMTPMEYFKRNFYASFWFETASLLPAVEKLGAGRIMFETDYPHPTCLYPSPVDALERSIGGLKPALQRQILQDNAAKLYRIEV
jgi:predicted TIM-barrel fold metal-dependent hydrolase